jgi:prophage DNA circulation protein
MSTALATMILSDTSDLLAVLRQAASTIDFSASVAAETSKSGAVAIANVAGIALIAQIDAVSADLSTLIASPAALATSLVGLVQGFAGTTVDFRNLADAIDNVTWSAAWLWNGIYGPQSGNNRDALQQLLIAQAVIEAVRAVSSMTFDSQDAAFALGNDLATRLDLVIRNSPTRSARASLRALKTALIADINSRAARLTALESWVNTGTVPALVLASRIYDDPTMAGDIATRNAITNPLFVAPGMLTILTPGAAA